MKFGRLRPPKRNPVRLLKYMGASLPVAPTEIDYSKPAMASLSKIYLNDQLGDCVIAGSAHLRGVTSSNAGSPCVVFADDQIVSLYGAIGGYVPGKPDTDQGCDESTALTYLTNTGYPDGVKLTGSAGVNADDPDEVRSALWLFENLVFGIELPDEWVNNMPSASGFTWDVAGEPNPENGHCIVGVGYNPTGVIVSTWGMLGTLTWAAVEKYASSPSGELHVALSPDAISRATGRAPCGFGFATLQSDLKAIP